MHVCDQIQALDTAVRCRELGQADHMGAGFPQTPALTILLLDIDEAIFAFCGHR